ncbi:MAG: hypothetical protein P8Y27_21315 [Chromatiaceae bacterium]
MTHSARSVPYLVAGLFVLGALSGCGGGGADVKSERERKKILNK